MTKTVTLSELLPQIRESINNGQSVRIPFTGKSMEPVFKEGRQDILLKKAEFDHIKAYDVIFFRRESGTFVLHRVVGKTKDGRLIACGDAQIMEEAVSKEQIIAVMEGYYTGRKRKRFVPADNRFYLFKVKVVRRINHIKLHRKAKK